MFTTTVQLNCDDTKFITPSFWSSNIRTCDLNRGMARPEARGIDMRIPLVLTRASDVIALYLY